MGLQTRLTTKVGGGRGGGSRASGLCCAAEALDELGQGALVNTCAEDSDVLPGEGILRKGRNVFYREWAVRSRKEGGTEAVAEGKGVGELDSIDGGVG